MNEYVEHCETKKWRKQIAEWKEEHPLTMKNRVDMGPQDIIEEINRQFDNAIIATDVGQHQMFTTQYIEQAADHFRWTWNDGIWFPGCNRSEAW